MRNTKYIKVNDEEKIKLLISNKKKLVVESVIPKIDVTNQCSECQKFYNDNDVAVLDDGVFCFNCIDLAKPEWRAKFHKTGRFTEKDIEKLFKIQYEITDSAEIVIV